MLVDDTAFVRSVMFLDRRKTILFTFVLALSVLKTDANDLVNYDNETSVATENATHAAASESEFPEDLFTEEQRKQGAIVLHVILALYCFAAIATVCTEYFLPTIRCICQDLKISDDVAAATFMSTATASPELFTNIIGTFITKSDIGVGHVLGNAYYDMFFVAAVGGLAAKKDVLLDWWPITRDCCIYLIVALTLTGIIWDGIVTTGETLILLSLYVCYFIIMFCNRRIIRFCREKFNIEMNDPVEDEEPKDYAINSRTIKEKNNLEVMDVLNPLAPPIPAPKPLKERRKWWRTARNILLQPLFILMSLSIPDVRKDKVRKFYPVTFVMCVVWIGMSTYFGTWMISTIGETIGVPDSVMGMVFMAAGGSVVEVYAVFYKVRRGECSIGLSNSMGCNSLDVTLCMALPWFVRCLIPQGETGISHVLIKSPGIRFNCSLLVISVVVLFAMLCCRRFKLNRISGAVSLVIYIAVLSIAIAMET
ncbi:UNVERIFIED_CONTAM: hypothetical protein PYX00_000539 [Menopon gallinae]|uniref:Sodium/calcium exchanger membrane region domain-containing protein n=1 Tax=Menopon gallinae TaxID=328185 RepID=A0AAW2I9L6_9NEOP